MQPRFILRSTAIRVRILSVDRRSRHGFRSVIRILSIDNIQIVNICSVLDAIFVPVKPIQHSSFQGVIPCENVKHIFRADVSLATASNKPQEDFPFFALLHQRAKLGVWEERYYKPTIIVRCKMNFIGAFIEDNLIMHLFFCFCHFFQLYHL